MIDDDEKIISSKRDEIFNNLMDIYNNPIIKAFGERLNSYYEENDINELESYNYVVEFEKMIKRLSGIHSKLIMKLFLCDENFILFLEECKKMNISLTLFKNTVNTKKDFVYFEKRYLYGDDKAITIQIKEFIKVISSELYGDIRKILSDFK